MGKILSERKGDRKFERVAQWTNIEYTLVSKNHRFAQFADNYGIRDDKLQITLVGRGQFKSPLRKYNLLPQPIILEDFTSLCKVDFEDNIFLEIDKEKDRVRMYKEIV